VWTANEKCEVELRKEFFRDDGRIVGIGRFWVWVVNCVVGSVLVAADGVGFESSYAASVLEQRGCDGGRFVMSRDPVLCHIFDEDPFPLDKE